MGAYLAGGTPHFPSVHKSAFSDVPRDAVGLRTLAAAGGLWGSHRLLDSEAVGSRGPAVQWSGAGGAALCPPWFPATAAGPPTLPSPLVAAEGSKLAPGPPFAAWGLVLASWLTPSIPPGGGRLLTV